MLLADTYLLVDPAWPWSLPGLGWPALAGVALVLMALSVWTYLGVRGVTLTRLLTILALRLGALLVACLLVLRPSLAREEKENIPPSRILMVVDASESMNVTDEFNHLSRWDNARRILSAPAVTEVLKTLAVDHKVEVVYYQASESIAKWDPEGKATGKRTDMGTWLEELLKTHGRETNLRGLLLFSDGADNGTRFPTLKQAARWTGVCPIYTFALGNPNTNLGQRDVAVVDMQPPLQPVPVKTQFSVTSKINAPGFEHFHVDVSLWIEDLATGEMKLALDKSKKGNQGGIERILLKKKQDNEVKLTRDAPVVPGEYKVTFKVDPLPGEVTDANNQMSSYLTVTKEGISILWVEGHQRLESTFILRHALLKDKRFRVFPALKLNEGTVKDEDWFNFDKQHYDIIVIGDLSAKRFSSNNPKVFEKIQQKITKEGTGLFLFGGHDAFANGWNVPEAKPLTTLLPVVLDKKGQLEGPVRMVPTHAGLDHYLLRLTDNSLENQETWKNVLDPLDGITYLGTVKPGATVLATGEGNEPILVGTQAGEGRVLAFAGDTTWKVWRRTPAMLPAYERFWKQTMLWLARQENMEGNAWIKPDTRRLGAATNQRLGFSVGLRGKGGIEIKNANFQVQVIGPAKDATDVPILAEAGENRGYYFKTTTPGEYRIQLVAKGKDVDGKDLEGKASARFLVHAENLENLRPAADHDFLARLAQAGGGRSYPADERKLLQFLEEIVQQKKTVEKPRVDLWPDWRRNPPLPAPGQSPSLRDQLGTLWSSAALPCLVLFVGFLSLEWYLRRRWGLV